MIITNGEIDINKMRRRVKTYISILIMTVLTAIISSCSEDENGLYGIDSINIKCIVADYQSNTFNITRTATETLPLSTNYDDSKIEKLDLLVYNGDELIQHLTKYFSNTSNTAIWDVKNKIPKDYLSNSSYTHILIANYPESSSELDELTLSALKSKQFTPDDYDPAKAFSNAIPMIQELPANETKPFDGTTLTFDALERVVAKVQIYSKYVAYGTTYNSTQIAWTTSESAHDDWIIHNYTGLNDLGDILTYEIDNNALIIKNGTDDRYNRYKISNEDFISANEWKMEFEWACKSSNNNAKQSRLNIKYANEINGSDIFSTSTQGNSTTTYIYDSEGDVLKTITTDATQIATWYRFVLIGDLGGVTLSIYDSSDNECLAPTRVFYGRTNAKVINFEMGKSYSYMGIKNISLSYKSEKTAEISQYKLINYIKGYNIYNNEDDNNYANDKNKSKSFGVENPIVEDQTGISNNENFIDFPNDDYSAMQGTNSFAFYVYPNYWFDSSKDRSQMEPIESEYQTCVLVKAKYVMDNGTLSNRYFYYKVPVNYRLPKYNDISKNNDYFDADIDQMCEDLFPKLRKESDLAKLSISEADKNNIINKLYSKMLNAIYYDRAPDQSEIDELSELCKDIYSAAEKAYNDYTINVNESTWNNTKTIKSNAKSAAKSTDLKARLSTIITTKDNIDIPNYYRIKRNHHYSAYVSFDQQGGEVENEALYIASEPFMDVVIRPEF